MFLHPYVGKYAGMFLFLLYFNNSAESCKLRQLSEFHLQSLEVTNSAENIRTVLFGRLHISANSGTKNCLIVST